ncbi:MAG TPA: ROK family transcriptional regulator [Chloroflexia bacterium]|jgi:predicted NBD/HSP70 family sugar kinase
MVLRLRSGNRDLIREINKSLVLSIVRDHEPISRTAISQTVNLSPATVSGITGELIEQGLIYEHEAGTSTGGRRPILLALNRQGGFVIGIKLAETHIVAALTDLGANVIDQRAAILGDDRQPEAVIAVLADTVNELRSLHPGRHIFGVGLGMAGAVDRRLGICHFSPFLNWHDVPLRRMLEQRLELPVVLENDVNTLTMSEKWFGAGVGVNDFLVITLGRGIGMGMVLNGQIYRGGCGGGGEFGHITVVPDGPQCECGKRGCLEALVSDPAILRRMRSAIGRELTMEEAAVLARQGDSTAQGIFNAAARTLGMAIADLVNIFNPPLLIVGGEGARAFDLLLEPLQEALQANCFNGFFDDMRLVVEPWGDDAWARGAASLMLEELFRPTLYHDDRARASLVLPLGAN